MSAQFTATSFWPDGSLKWVLIDFTDSFEANEKRVYTLDFGSEIRRAETTQQGVTIEENDDVISVNTGPLQAQINKQTFKLFDGVWIEGQRVAFSGAVGSDSSLYGKLFTTSARPPESVRVEEAGHEKVVIRAEGYGADDAKSTCAMTRLTFRRIDPRASLTRI